MLVSGTAPPPRPLTSIAIPTDGGTPRFGRDGDEIETPRVWPQSEHRAAKIDDLCIGEMLQRAGAGLYFDRNDYAAVADEQVDFSTTRTNVAADNGTAPPNEKPRSYLLAEVA